MAIPAQRKVSCEQHQWWRTKPWHVVLREHFLPKWHTILQTGRCRLGASESMIYAFSPGATYLPWPSSFPVVANQPQKDVIYVANVIPCDAQFNANSSSGGTTLPPGRSSAQSMKPYSIVALAVHTLLLSLMWMLSCAHKFTFMRSNMVKVIHPIVLDIDAWSLVLVVRNSCHKNYCCPWILHFCDAFLLFSSWWRVLIMEMS
jgi:hypothetical protein